MFIARAHHHKLSRSVRSAMFIAARLTDILRSVRSAMFIAARLTDILRSVRSAMFDRKTQTHTLP